MKLFLRNTLTGLVPLFPEDFDEKRKLKLGQDYECEVKIPRNLGFHRKFFALLNVGYENTSLDMPFESYRKYIVMKAGYFKTYQTANGVFYDAESISFASMPEETFEELYGRAMDVIIKDIGSTSEEIQEQVLNFM